MQTAYSFILVFALIKVSVGEGLIERTYHKVNGLVNVRFADARSIPNIRCKLQCAGACDQIPWCNAITWDEKAKACHGFTRNIHREATPPGVSHVYMSDKDLCFGDGYTYTSGMCIKFFADKPQTTWQEAQNFCISEGGRLVVADTMEKFHYIINRLKTDTDLRGLHGWWLGGRKVHGSWMWTTDEPISLEISEIEPDRSLCLELYTGILHDFRCSWSRHLICET